MNLCCASAYASRCSLHGNSALLLMLEDQQVVSSRTSSLAGHNMEVQHSSRDGASNCYIKRARALYRPGAGWD